MMISRLLQIPAMLGLIFLVTGCKLLVVSSPGGDVTSLSTTRNCAGGSVCEFQIEDGFSESFLAVPKPGYHFVRWEKGTDLNCGDSTDPTCTVALTGNAAVDAAAIASFEIVHIMPVYKHVGIDTDGDTVRDELDPDDDNDGILDVDDNCPVEGPNDDGFGCPNGTITSTNVAAGRTWAQPGLFRNTSQAELNAACPAGDCAGMLRGFRVDGWNLATSEDVAPLFDAILGISCPAVECIDSSPVSLYRTNVEQAGWQLWLRYGSFSLLGYTSNGNAMLQVDDDPFYAVRFSTSGWVSDTGAWLYRD